MQSAIQSSTILGKRKATGTLILRLTSSPEPSNGPSDSESDHPAPSSSRPHIFINGTLVQNTKKRYQCTYQGCTKAYAKPVRLAEHERSHTGQRPFVCSVCQKSYLREAHLQAHARSHLPNSARPIVCPETGCDKRFWTTQHLRVHTGTHNGAKPFCCTAPSCSEGFAKHHQLRDHMAKVHAPPGTKPYQCAHEGCTKSFDTNQHLRTHTKVHDDSRYGCVYPACLTASKRFPTWTALQHHLRNAHPPTCSDPSCNGRVFATQKGLRAHQKLHEERAVEAVVESAAGDNYDDADDARPRKRRRGGEINRDWICDVAGCGRDFKSKKALLTHTNVTHLGRRDYVCSHAGCGAAYGYKHVLQRHLARAHASGSGSDSDSSPEDDVFDAPRDKGTHNLGIDDITGRTYAERAKERLQSAMGLRCPYPHLDTIAFSASADEEGRERSMAPADADACDYVFSRAYDLRRHLRAAHMIEAEKESVDEWVRAAKLARR